MRRTPSLLLRALAPVLLVALASACEGCLGPEPEDDAGDGGETTLPDGDGGGRQDGGGTPDSGPPPDGAVGPLCDEDTLGFGEPCGDCGFFLCDQNDELVCYDEGFNDCGGCGDIDTSAGRTGDSCGEHGCGVVSCNAEGTATICLGDHERNVCGGCGTITPPDRGEPCSECGTGTRTCTRDQDALVCWRGRAPNNQCSSCEPCVQYHAFMDERFGGGYLRTGTVAVFEDAGNAQRQMVFLPLIEGPGAAALPLAHFFLTNSAEPELTFPPFGCLSDLECPGTQRCILDMGVCIEGAWLPMPFSAHVGGLDLLADPVRSYSTGSLDLSGFQYLMLYDWFLERVISLGEIVPGPPPGLLVDGGPAADGGLDDAGEAPSDGGTTSDGVGDAGEGDDAGDDDAGFDDDAGVDDDAGGFDAGDGDGGALDGGMDAG